MVQYDRAKISPLWTMSSMFSAGNPNTFQPIYQSHRTAFLEQQVQYLDLSYEVQKMLCKIQLFITSRAEFGMEQHLSFSFCVTYREIQLSVDYY